MFLLKGFSINRMFPAKKIFNVFSKINNFLLRRYFVSSLFRSRQYIWHERKHDLVIQSKANWIKLNQIFQVSVLIKEIHSKLEAKFMRNIFIFWSCYYEIIIQINAVPQNGIKENMIKHYPKLKAFTAHKLPKKMNLNWRMNLVRKKNNDFFSSYPPSLREVESRE